MATSRGTKKAKDAGERPKRARNEGGERTRLRILDAAEKLFAAHGLDGASMREIALRAEVPLALANYHFGSKFGLYRAVFKHRIESIATERSARLKEILARPDPSAHIADILDIMVRPWIKLHQSPGGRAYAQLVAREIADPAEGDRGILAEFLDPFAQEFIRAFVSFDEATPIRAQWAYHFFSGALILMLANPERVQRLSGGLCDTNTGDDALNQIVSFFAGAFDSKKPKATPRKKTGKTGKKTDRTKRLKSTEAQLLF